MLFLYMKTREVIYVEENLKPVRSKDEARERGRKGGVASGKSRREKKTLTETLKKLLEMKYEYDGQTVDGFTMTCVALFKQAQDGNVKAFEVIRDTVGEKPIAGISLESGESDVKDIKISFVDKSDKAKCKESDPKIIGEYTPPTETEV